MTPLVLKYPLDLTGKSSNNLVVGEPHSLPDRKVRVFATTYGPFYTKGLVIREVGSGRELIPEKHFKAIELEPDATAASGLEVCCLIAVTDPTIGSELVMDYQVVGGQYSDMSAALKNLVETLDLDDRPIKWADILAKPSAYPPTAHNHDVNDLYGFEYLVAAINDLREAVINGDAAGLDELRRLILEQVARLEDLINKARANAIRSIALEGDVTGNALADNNPDVILKAILADVVKAGEFVIPTVNSKGLVIGGRAIKPEDLAQVDWKSIINLPTTLKDFGITDALSVNGGKMLGDLGILTMAETKLDMGNVAGNVVIDATKATVFTATPTASCNWTFTGRPTDAKTARYLELRLTNGGNFTQVFPTGTLFAGGDKEFTANGVDKLIIVLTSTYTDITMVRGMAA